MGRSGARLVLVAALTVLAPPAHALDPGRRITQYTRDVWLSKDGLPEGEILAVHQSKDGYLWLGTRRGLVRFDGARFRVYDATNTEAIPSSAAQAVAMGADGSEQGLTQGTLRAASARCGEAAWRTSSPRRPGTRPPDEGSPRRLTVTPPPGRRETTVISRGNTQRGGAAVW